MMLINFYCNKAVSKTLSAKKLVNVTANITNVDSKGNVTIKFSNPL